ncbi:MAG: nucleoside monophosphate kinase [Patescibacteria group bacterium]
MSLLETNESIGVVGPPCSGKTLFGLEMAKRLILHYVLLSKLMDEHVALKGYHTEEILRVKPSGNLVSAEVVCDVLEWNMDKYKPRVGMLIDSPRTCDQAEALDAMLERKGLPLAVILHLDASKRLCTDRNKERLAKEDRVDDDPAIFSNRWENWLNLTVPMLSYYRSKSRLIMISVTPEKTVADLAQEAIDLMKRRVRCQQST